MGRQKQTGTRPLATGGTRGHPFTPPIAAAVTLALLLAAVGCTPQQVDRTQSSRSGTGLSHPVSATTKERLRALLPASTRRSGVITVAVTPTYSPYEYLDDDGRTVVGVNPSVMAVAAEILGIGIRYEKLNDFANTLAGVRGHRYDAALIFGDSPELEKQMNIATFYEDGVVLVGRASLGSDPANLCGRKIAMGLSDTTSKRVLMLNEQLCMSQGRPSFVFKKVANTWISQASLLSGQLDLDATSTGVAKELTSKTGGRFTILSEEYFRIPTGVGLDNTKPGLARALRATFQVMIENGSMEEIFRQHGLESQVAERALVNSVGGRPLS